METGRAATFHGKWIEYLIATVLQEVLELDVLKCAKKFSGAEHICSSKMLFPQRPVILGSYRVKD